MGFDFSDSLFLKETMLTRYGVFVKKEEFIKSHGIKVYKKLADDLYLRTIVDKYRNIIKTANLLEQHKATDSFVLPRFVGFKLESSGLLTIKNTITPFILPKTTDQLPFTPTPNQETIVKHLMKTIYTQENINKGCAGCVLNLSAGQGKTYVAAYLTHLFNCTTLIVVPNETLLNQTVAVMKQVFPNKIIGAYYCKYKFVGDIT